MGRSSRQMQMTLCQGLSRCGDQRPWSTQAAVGLGLWLGVGEDCTVAPVTPMFFWSLFYPSWARAGLACQRLIGYKGLESDPALTLPGCLSAGTRDNLSKLSSSSVK